MSSLSFARRLAGLIYREGHLYRVPFGPLRGLRLRYEAQVNIREILGLWELQSFALVALLQRKGLLGDGFDVIYDVGANFGLYGMYFARQVAPHGVVYAFEPAAVPRRLMAENLIANCISNVVIDPRACSDVDGEVAFFLAANHHTSSLLKQRADRENGASESVSVRSVTLDRHWKDLADFERRLVLVKIDIEGAGSTALKHCVDVAESQRSFFLIESHSRDEDTAIGALAKAGYFCAYRVNDGRWVSEPEATYPNPNGIWGTLLLVPHERTAEVRRSLE